VVWLYLTPTALRWPLLDWTISGTGNGTVNSNPARFSCVGVGIGLGVKDDELNTPSTKK